MSGLHPRGQTQRAVADREATHSSLPVTQHWGTNIMGKTYKDQARWRGKWGKHSGPKWDNLPRVRIEKGGELVETPATKRDPKHKERTREAWRNEY